MEINSLNNPSGVKRYPVFRIEPTRGWTALKLVDLWESRELLGIFVWRDLKVRYRQTVIGALWAIVQPFLTMVIFSVFFGRLAGVPSDSIPYPIFSYAALVPWTFFANSINQASNSLVNNAEMIKKIYFPAPDHAVCIRVGGTCGFPSGVHHFNRDDVLLRICSDDQYPLVPALPSLR
jgi:lipopolysaccharide transport system permease protein